MVLFDSNSFFILFVYIFQTTFITANRHDNHQFGRTNNNDLQTCLSSSLPLTTRALYPCNTLANHNSSQYQCDHFNVSRLSSVRGGRISHSPAVVVYAMDNSDVQNVVKCATKLDYIVNALSGGHSYEGYGLGSIDNNIIINMEAINHINVNQRDGTGTFGAGARLGPIYYRTYQYEKYTINAGTCAWVGLAGQALGGGQGFLSRLYGLLSDNTLEMKAVNAEGSYVVVISSILNRDRNPNIRKLKRAYFLFARISTEQFRFRSGTSKNISYINFRLTGENPFFRKTYWILFDVGFHVDIRYQSCFALKEH